MIAGALNAISRRNRCDFFMLYVAGLRIEIERTGSGPWLIRDLQQFAIAFEVNKVSIIDLPEIIGRSLGRTQDGPNRWVLRTEAPNGIACGLETARGTHLVVSGNSIEEPHRVMRSVVFVILEP